MSTGWRLTIIFLFGVAALVLAFSQAPIPQDPAYHNFADQRSWLGIPRAADVLSNAAFVLVGFSGLWFVGHPFVAHSRTSSQAFVFGYERLAMGLFFAGVFLTGFGSAWYHLQPDNGRLFWDRLPITLALMGIFSALVSERVDPRVGLWLLAPLAAAGALSVGWWIWTENQGQGDLRAYAFVQFYPPLAIGLMLALLPSRYTRGADYWLVLLFYALAKLFEHLDRAIFDLTRVVSGHSLKHLFAAMGCAWALRMLMERKPQEYRRLNAIGRRDPHIPT
jgi:hypothetical protein